MALRAAHGPLLLGCRGATGLDRVTVQIWSTLSPVLQYIVPAWLLLLVDGIGDQAAVGLMVLTTTGRRKHQFLLLLIHLGILLLERARHLLRRRHYSLLLHLEAVVIVKSLLCLLVWVMCRLKLHIFFFNEFFY